MYHKNGIGGGHVRCGVSTACFYPLDTLESLKILADNGVSVIELFFNTGSELQDVYLSKISDTVSRAGIEVSSVHPYTALMEGFYFASTYKARLDDGLDLYQKYYEACQVLHCDKLVFHGDHDYNVNLFSAEEYADHYSQLAALGRQYGVTLCHENVAYCRLGLPQRVRQLSKQLGDDAAFVLDLKQARRNQIPYTDMLDAMHGNIRQVHISDFQQEKNCLPPGAGVLDFEVFLGELSKTGYDGDLIIELYSENYQTTEELINSMHYVQNILHTIKV